MSWAVFSKLLRVDSSRNQEASEVKENPTKKWNAFFRSQFEKNVDDFSPNIRKDDFVDFLQWQIHALYGHLCGALACTHIHTHIYMSQE